LGAGNQWVGGGERERVMGGEYYRNTLYTCMKIAEWSPPKTAEKEGEEGKWLRKSNIEGVTLYQSPLYTCYKYHNETPLYD
jgi:hypothetical protein